MCIVPELERSKLFTSAIGKFVEENPDYWEQMKENPNIEALLDLPDGLTPMSFSEIQDRFNTIIQASNTAMTTLPEESAMIIERELDSLLPSGIEA